MPSAVVGTHMPRAGYPPTVRPWQRRKAKQIKKLRAPAPRPRAYASLRRAARHTASQRKHSPRHVVTRARPPLQQLQQRRAPRVCASVNWTDLSRTPPAPPCCTTSRLATAANTCCVVLRARAVQRARVPSTSSLTLPPRFALVARRFSSVFPPLAPPAASPRRPRCLGSSNAGSQGDERSGRTAAGWPGRSVVVVVLRRKAGLGPAGGRHGERERDAQRRLFMRYVFEQIVQNPKYKLSRAYIVVHSGT